MRAEGNAVAIAQLCRWFGVPRSTFYYRPTTGAVRVPALDPALVATVRAIIEAEPAAGLQMITARVRRASPVPINRKKVHRILKVNGWQVRQQPRGQRPRVRGLDLLGHSAQRAVGGGHDASLLRPRRLVSPDGDH